VVALVNESEESRKLKTEKENEKRDLELTRNFINRYLNPDRHWREGFRLNEQLNIINKNLTFNALEYASRMDYCDFLKTPYWKIITAKVKQMHNYTCQLCGKSGVQLHTHHPSNYSFRGFEINHLDDLMCLCSDCHSKFHNKS
jgi:5-methylcytosine-specific restriction endonuclease McrA